MATHPEKIHVLIPCAGSGSRAGTALPKQYTLLEGLPLVIHTVQAFAKLAGLSQCLLVVAPDDVTLAAAIRSGGRLATAAESVKALLQSKALDAADVNQSLEDAGVFGTGSSTPR